MNARMINRWLKEGAQVYAQDFADVTTDCWVRIIRAKTIGGILLLKNLNGHWMHTHSGTKIESRL